MAEYTPSTEEVREAYAKRRALYLASSGHVLANDAKYNSEDYVEFDRWLAAHDAEVLRNSAEAFPDNEHDAGVKPAAVRKWMNARAFRIKQGREVER